MGSVRDRSNSRRDDLWRVVSPAGLLQLLLLFLGLTPSADAATPPVPSQPVPSCAATVSGKCYVNGPFTLTATSAGAHHYRVCRSNDTTGWGGCNFVMTQNTGATYTVSGSNLPSHGFRRAFYFKACDSANNCTDWGDNSPAYVSMDTSGPTQPGTTSVSCAHAPSGECWVTGNFTASVSPSSDSDSGVDGYQICRSQDSPGGWAGCQVNLSLDGGTSITVSGSHLPSAGSRRAYYFRAKDNVGNWGPWNAPRYVRVDRNNPTVSANNASPNWFTSRTATIAAADSAGGSVANSGLDQVRYRWNAVHNGSCTTGTATSSGATLTVPAGDNRLYLCAKDRTGRVSFWNGQYRVDSGPTQPGPTTVACTYTPSGECWVTGSFTASVTPSTASSGIDGYQICRSNDSPGGWAGCEVNLALDGGTSINIAGSHLPSDGFRRAYYFRAKDNNGTWGPWNTPRYVRIDRYSPTVSATNASSQWFSSRSATLSADDSIGGASVNTGLAEVRYRWNAALNGGCTNGTVASVGATLTAPEGDNTLYLCARDHAGRVTQWNGQYRIDTTAPSRDAITVSSQAWSIANGITYDIVAKASDAGSGVRELRALINLQGSNRPNRRGFFSWRHPSLSYQWSADRVACTGGGYASKHPTNHNPGTITLVGCSTSLVGDQRTVTFTLQPNSTFGEFGPINDISLWARDFELNRLGWLNFDLNFSSYISATPPKLVVSSPPGGALPHNGVVDWGVVDPGSGTGNLISRPIRVRNGAASGSANLLLQGSPTNVEVVNTQGNAFSWTGTLDSPLAPGQQDDFTVRMNTSQSGTFAAVLKIWHNDFVRPMPLRIQLGGTVSAPEPVVDRVDRSPVLRGQQKVIIVHGQNLQGASVYIGTDAPDEGAPPPNRVYPTAELVTINSAGTRLEARIDATAPGIDGFYNLGIETPGGATGAQFRVVGPQPVIDLWTPSEPVVGRVHVLHIAGVNLQNASVTPMSSGVKILDLDNSDDEALSGLMFIGNGVPPGAIDLRIDGVGGSTTLPLLPRFSDSEATKTTQKIDTTGAQPGSPTPHIYIQDPVSPHSDSELLAVGKALADDFDKSISAKDLADAEKSISFCFSIGIPRTISFSQILLSLSTDLGDPLTQQAINALLPGQSLDFSSLTVAIVGFIQFEFFFQICDGVITDLRFCIRAGLGIMVPGIGGWSVGIDLCFGLNQQEQLPPEGRVDNHQWTTDSPCVRAQDDSPGSILGDRQSTLIMDCCDNASIGLQTSGVVFNQAFNVEIPAIEVEPECTNCEATVILEDQKLLPEDSNEPLTASIQNSSTETCRHRWQITKTDGTPDVTVSPSSGEVTLGPGQTRDLDVGTSVTLGTSARDEAKLTLSVTSSLTEPPDGPPPPPVTNSTDAHVCIIPWNEISDFDRFPNPGEDAGLFRALVGPLEADFSGRIVHEGEGVQWFDFYDNCYLSALPPEFEFTRETILAGRVHGWEVGTNQTGSGTNWYGFDWIGARVNLDQIYKNYRPRGCDIGAKQRMFIECPNLSPRDVIYWINDIEIQVFTFLEQTVICRDKGSPPAQECSPGH